MTNQTNEFDKLFSPLTDAEIKQIKQEEYQRAMREGLTRAHIAATLLEVSEGKREMPKQDELVKIKINGGNDTITLTQFWP